MMVLDSGSYRRTKVLTYHGLRGKRRSLPIELRFQTDDTTRLLLQKMVDREKRHYSQDCGVLCRLETAQVRQEDWRNDNTSHYGTASNT